MILEHPSLFAQIYRYNLNTIGNPIRLRIIYTALCKFSQVSERQKYFLNVSECIWSMLRFHNRVVNLGWPAKNAPSFKALFTACKSILQWLKKDPANVTVVHCMVGGFIGLYWFQHKWMCRKSIRANQRLIQQFTLLFLFLRTANPNLLCWLPQF